MALDDAGQLRKKMGRLPRGRTLEMDADLDLDKDPPNDDLILWERRDPAVSWVLYTAICSDCGVRVEGFADDYLDMNSRATLPEFDGWEFTDDHAACPACVGPGRVEWDHTPFDDKNWGDGKIHESWDHRPDPEWRWHVDHVHPGGLMTSDEHFLFKQSGQREHFTWSVSFQGGDSDRWKGADRWFVGGVCTSGGGARAACEQVGPKVYELWVSTRLRKN